MANGRLLLPLSPAAQNISSRLPQSSDPCGFGLHRKHPARKPGPGSGVRIDYQLNTKNSLFARYLASPASTRSSSHELSPEDVLTASGIGTDDLAQSLTGGFTTVVSDESGQLVSCVPQLGRYEPSGREVFRTAGRRDQRLHLRRQVSSFGGVGCILARECLPTSSPTLLTRTATTE